ncbi:hypothetical protein DUNSADRAFT_13693 [Dunaliella salina]|uniref:Uncharacterized protein n=1 Tax=Dunaliella salina TaxID=3046 RepID=A0ABQ7G8U2_DUNSA|nr:hypothetical protein DUNSADRAFT_13693 [Dunaliella salina]|eukprot:KAF5831024.1 hypothetical protein DUNSADRAFT_13693 [Dunaliella salina]
MGLWNMIISQTSQSHAKLWIFGTLATGAAFVIGDMFTGSMMKEERALPGPQHRGRHPDDERVASGRQARLVSIIKDIQEGRGDAHWQAAMRGTLLAHPTQENKTQGIDNELAARLKGNAEASR